jgi:hypothetical protein
MTFTASPAATGTQTGLDADTLKMTLEAIRDYIADALPEERQLQLDHDDVCPEDLVRGMCSDQLGVQLLFIPEEYGGMGGGTIDVYRVCEVPRQRPDLLRSYARTEARMADRDRGAGSPVRLRRNGARSRQRPWRAQDNRDPGHRRWLGRRIPAQWAKAMDQQRGNRGQVHDPGERARRPVLVRAPA